MKIFTLGIFFLNLNACVSAPVEPEVVEKAEEPAPVALAPSLKRIIKNEDLRKGRSDQTFKKRVIVLPFLDRSSGRSETVLKNARDEFMNQLNRTQDLIAISSAELNLDLAKSMKNNEYDLAALAHDAQTSGASALLQAKVIDLRFKNQNESESQKSPKKASFEIVVQAKLINIRSGQELFNTVKTVTLEEENTPLPENISSDLFFNRNPELVELLIKDAFVDFSPQLAESMNQIIWEGRIAALQGEKIYLNVGQISGVQLGDILKVVEDGNEVYDPEIGYHIGKVPGKIKGTVEVISFFGQDGAIGVIHSGAGFKENDRIELYQ